MKRMMNLGGGGNCVRALCGGLPSGTCLGWFPLWQWFGHLAFKFGGKIQSHSPLVG
jgi:hypothetical protein